MSQQFHTICDELANLPWPNPLMGKPEDDERKLIEAIDRWIKVIPTGDIEKYLLQPNPNAEEYAARTELAMAAAAWAYWKRDPYKVIHNEEPQP